MEQLPTEFVVVVVAVVDQVVTVVEEIEFVAMAEVVVAVVVEAEQPVTLASAELVVVEQVVDS